MLYNVTYIIPRPIYKIIILCRYIHTIINTKLSVYLNFTLQTRKTTNNNVIILPSRTKHTRETKKNISENTIFLTSTHENTIFKKKEIIILIYIQRYSAPLKEN